MTETELIEQYRIKHSQGSYGTSSIWFKDIIHNELAKLKPEIVLDFGCGQTRLEEVITHKCQWYKYDPAIPEYSKLPVTKADLVRISTGKSCSTSFSKSPLVTLYFFSAG